MRVVIIKDILGIKHVSNKPAIVLVHFNDFTVKFWHLTLGKKEVDVKKLFEMHKQPQKTNWSFFGRQVLKMDA